MRTIKKIQIVFTILVCFALPKIAVANVIELPLDLEGRYNQGNLYTAIINFNISFVEITSIQLNWSGEIWASVDDSHDLICDTTLLVRLGYSPATTLVYLYGGAATYPESEPFSYVSDFSLQVQNQEALLFDLFDGESQIEVYLASPGFGGQADIHSISLVIDGIPSVPEPATLLLLLMGIIGIKRIKTKTQ